MRAIQRACPFTLALGKTAPAAEIPCQAVVPLSACPTPPDDTDLQPSPASALHAPAPQAAPVATPCAAATCLAVSTLGRSTPADAPDLKAHPAASRTSASLCVCARSRPCSATPTCPTLGYRPVRRPHTAAIARRVLPRRATRAPVGGWLSSPVFRSGARWGWRSGCSVRRWAANRVFLKGIH